MTATTTVTGSSEKPPEVGPPRKRGSILTRLARPFRQSHGVQRFMLVSGTVMSLMFIVMAIFAPLIAPYDHDTQPGRAGRLPAPGRAVRPQPVGHDRARHGRAVAHDLGRAHGARGRRSSR